jgi:hypothetical protein
VDFSSLSQMKSPQPSAFEKKEGQNWMETLKYGKAKDLLTSSFLTEYSRNYKSAITPLSYVFLRTSCSSYTTMSLDSKVKGKVVPVL